MERSLRGSWERNRTAFRSVAGAAVFNRSRLHNFWRSSFPAMRGAIKKPPSDSTVVSVSESEIEKIYFFSATTLVNLPFSKASLPKTAST